MHNDVGHSNAIPGEDLRSVNRCRISSCSIFLSDIASASGRTLDQTRGLQGVDYTRSTTYDSSVHHDEIGMSGAVFGRRIVCQTAPFHVDSASGKTPRTGDWNGFTLKVWIFSYNAQTESIGSIGNALTVPPE